MGKIYRLECVDGHYYYGSTRGSLETRFIFHKKDSKTKHSPVYAHINMIGWDSVNIVLVEEVGDGLKKREDEYIRSHIADPLCLNVNIVIATNDDMKKWQKIYRDTHKESEKERVAAWQKANPEKAAARQRKYAEKDLEQYKSNQKAWYERNRANVLAKQKAYKDEHREKIQAYAKKYYESVVKKSQ